jgi:hypothetical protein
LTGARPCRGEDGEDTTDITQDPTREPRHHDDRNPPVGTSFTHRVASRLGRTDGTHRSLVAGSLLTGVAAALLLVAAPFTPAGESAVTGAALCGFALGWAMLAVLSVRLTDQPQRWAAAPAVVLAAGGSILIGFGSPAHEVLDWVWPPTMLALAIWMVVHAGRHLHSRSRRRLLYPVIAVMALASIGGGYETVQEAVDARSTRCLAG